MQENTSNKLMIGIPVHNDLDSFKEMIKSLKTSTIAYDKIVIVESGSTDGAKEFCHNLARVNPVFEVIHTKKEGPLKAYNRLFKLAKEREMDLFLTQTDVMFPKLYKRDWLGMMRHIADKSDCMSVTCINGGGISGDDYCEGLKWIGGWCHYIPLRMINEVSGYDTKYPAGWGVDIDYTMAALMNGNVYSINYWVDHHMLNERNHDNDPEADKLKKEAGNYFKEKWKDELDRFRKH